MLERQAYDLVRRELEPGESVVWYDSPVPGYFTPKALASFIFGIPWTAFAIFWTCGAAGFKIPGSIGQALFPLFGLPFILIGFGMLSAPFWTRSQALKTVYAITDKRALVITAGRSMTVKSVMPESFIRITRKEKRDGTGHISYEDGGTDGEGNVISDNLFVNVREPREVERMLRELAGKRASGDHAIEYK